MCRHSRCTYSTKIDSLFLKFPHQRSCLPTFQGRRYVCYFCIFFPIRKKKEEYCSYFVICFPFLLLLSLFFLLSGCIFFSLLSCICGKNLACHQYHFPPISIVRDYMFDVIPTYRARPTTIVRRPEVSLLENIFQKSKTMTARG